MCTCVLTLFSSSRHPPHAARNARGGISCLLATRREALCELPVQVRLRGHTPALGPRALPGPSPVTFFFWPSAVTKFHERRGKKRLRQGFDAKLVHETVVVLLYMLEPLFL